MKCRELKCDRDDQGHTEEFCEVFLRKLLRPLLANWAGDLNATVERMKLTYKPLSWKVVRF